MTLTVADAIANLRDHGRDLRDPEDLNEVAQALGSTLRWEGRPTNTFHRATYTHETAELPSVSVAACAVALAHDLVPGFVDPGSPFHGHGRNSEWRAQQAAAALAEHFGIAVEVQ